MTLLVVMFAVAGCVYMLESVFFLNVEVFGVNDSVGERIRVFSVGNVELIFKNWFTFSMRRPSSLFTRAVWKARVWLASTHYIESEITSWLHTSKYIVLT